MREASFRSRGGVLTRYVLGSAALAAVGVAISLARGLPWRVPPEVQRFDASREDRSELFGTCAQQASKQTLPAEECVTGQLPLAAIWGDSHADSFAPAVRAWASRHGMGFAQVTNGGCPALPGATIYLGHQVLRDCLSFTPRAFAALAADQRVSVVFIASRWALYTSGSRVGPEGGAAVFLADASTSAPGPDDSRRVFLTALRRAVVGFRAAGKRVVVVGQAPEAGFDVPDCWVRRGMPLGGGPDCSIPAAPTLERAQFSSDAISALARELPGTTAFLPDRFLCGEQVCETLRDGNVMYVDDDHLSRTGALWLSRALESALAASSTGTDRP